MLSILIPTYNYNVFPLAKALSAEAENISHPIEIIFLDDASSLYFAETEKLETLPFIRYYKLAENGGRTTTRNLLAEKATYSKLLFLDADVVPVHTDFITRYLKYIDKKGIVLGGITYKKEKPDTNEILRWTYGHARETLTVTQRNKAMYSSITTACFLIEKELFLEINKTIKIKTYGEDLLFKQKLEAQKIPVLHIDNPVYHLGLESNEQFLQKSLEAIDTTLVLEETGELPTDSRNIQKIYLKLKKWHAVPLFQLYYSTISSKVKRNLLSEDPNMRWFDLYRLQYYIQLKQKKIA
ncbi:glycosyltransferase family 2 protein [Rasiella sp. SM2506]|uniref:glycosyltransferase family 2 protein n=1 Tax=Rasiella sp. SM2506 TaxID=3423914 RepID=UPI003D7962F7